MNLVRTRITLIVISSVIALTAACGTEPPPPATPTPLPTPIPLQVAPTFTPIPPSPTRLAPTATTVPARTNVPTVVASPTANPKDLAQAAFNKALANLKTYRVEVPQESRYIAVQLPDRFLQEGLDSAVKIGGSLWTISMKGMRMGTGTTPYFERADINWYKQQFAQAPQVILLGPGMAEGVACIGYSINVPMTKVDPPKTRDATPVTSQVSMPIKIWFATTDGFPRRVDFGAPLSLTINFYDFNDYIIITPPQ
jgi:hypothetical protein